jgi:transglutaminase-like putative cysteine protease
LNEDLRLYLQPTDIIDSDHPGVREYADRLAKESEDPVTVAVALYLGVRDDIRYDPYAPFYLPEHYKASYVLDRGRSFCIPKASLLCALGRARRVPSRVGFATVRNHLATKQLIDFLGGSDLFPYHGFVEFHLEGKWVKATPAFNKELCDRHKVPPLDFNGREDSLFHPYNLENSKFMEYVDFHGVHADIPVEEIVTAWKRVYGKDRVENWIRIFESGSSPISRFENEDVLKR